MNNPIFSSTAELSVEQRGPVLWLTITREERRNAMSHGVYTLKKVASMAFEESMSFTESQIALFTLTEDANEGQKAFQEKRKPNWIGH